MLMVITTDVPSFIFQLENRHDRCGIADDGDFLALQCKSYISNTHV